MSAPIIGQWTTAQRVAGGFAPVQQSAQSVPVDPAMLQTVNAASVAQQKAAAAAGSATSAANSATAAAASATGAATSATAAAGSATSAANSATTATTQAGNASTSATAAAGLATAAANSATTATTQAGNASTSATAAAGSAAGAAASAAGLPWPYYATRAAGAASSIAVNQYFISDETGTMSRYQKTSASPFYALIEVVPTAAQIAAKVNTADLAGTGGAAMVGVNPGFTMQDLVDPGEQMLAVLLKPIQGMGGMHCFGIDSLTDGAGGYNWRGYYESIMRANLGYGGPGYETFGLGGSQDRGATYFATGSRAEISIQTTNTYDWMANWAPGGGGQALYGTGYFTWAPEAKWSTVKVFYLKGPTCGAFTWTPSYSGFSGSATTVDCYAATSQVAYFSYTVPVGTAAGFRFDWAAGTTNPTGPVVIYGGDFVWDATKFRPCNLAQGGRQFTQVMAQDATARRAFFAAVTPALYIGNMGVNDRAIMDGPTFGTNLTSFVTDLQTAAPNMQINLVQPLQTNDTPTTYIKDYYAQRVTVAKAKHCGLVDLRKALGLYNYATANAAGYMVGGSDTVHPGQLGDIATARVHALAIGASPALIDPGKTAYDGSGGAAVKVWTGNLSEKDGVALTAPAAAASGGTITVTSAGAMTVVAAPTTGAYAIGQQICATGLLVGTFITAGSGTSWTLSQGATISSATAAYAYTVTRTVLWTLGMIPPYNTAVFTVNMAAQRGPVGSAVNVQKVKFSLTNASASNTAFVNGSGNYIMVITSELVTYSGDGQTIQYLIDVRNKSSTNQVEVGIIPIALNTSAGFGGAVTATGSFAFTNLGATGQSVFEN